MLLNVNDMDSKDHCKLVEHDLEHTSKFQHRPNKTSQRSESLTENTSQTRHTSRKRKTHTNRTMGVPGGFAFKMEEEIFLISLSLGRPFHELKILKCHEASISLLLVVSHCSHRVS